MPFTVTLSDVPDPQLGPLLTVLAEAGWSNPLVQPASLEGEDSQAGTALPDRWRKVRSIPGQSYRWPKTLEEYERYTIYAADTAHNGRVRIALGEAPRAGAWGRNRRYVVAFLSDGAPQVPLVEFLEADPEGSGEMISVIRGFGGGASRRMYGPSDPLPPPYPDAFRIESYRDRIHSKGAWNKLCVVTAEEDRGTMLNHALLQARRRGDL
jgi:hypothetical protein